MPGTFAILKHAFGMIFRDPSATLRALAPGLALIFGAALALYLIAPEAAQMLIANERDPAQMMEPARIGAMLIGIIAMLIGFIVTAVIWHRFVLLQGPDRDAGLTPGAGIIGRYIWRTFLLGLIMIVVSIPIMFIVGLLIAGLSGMGGVGLFGLLSVLATAILGWIAMRLSLVLPATALSQPMGFKESWSATSSVSGTVFALTIALSILNLILTRVVGALIPEPLILTGSLQLVFSILMALVSASVLTTLYGTLVEGRQLVD